jgi:hypothetical protein
MDGIIWVFLVLFVALVAFGVVAVTLRRRQSGVDPHLTHCSNCQTPMSLRRVSWIKSLFFLAAWECPHCGNRSRSRTGTAV